MEFFIPVLLKDDIMTLKFNPKFMPEYADAVLIDALNSKIGTFNDDADKLDAAMADAYRVLRARAGDFATKFTTLAEELHAAVLAAPLGEDDDREELFACVRDTLNDELWDFQHGTMTFALQFDEDGVNLDFWEASSC